MQSKTMVILAVILIVAGFLMLANRRAIIDTVYNNAAEQIRAKMDQPEFDEATLQAEARQLELRVVRTDEALLYGGILLGLLGLVFMHASLVTQSRPNSIPAPHPAASHHDPPQHVVPSPEPEEDGDDSEDTADDDENPGEMA